MATKIRLSRRGRKKLAIYDVVVSDSRAPRNGMFIEKLGTYNPNISPSRVDIDIEKAFEWVMKGAEPTNTVRNMLSDRGVMYRKHLQIGVNKGAISQEEADKRYEEWKKQKDEKLQQELDSIQKKKEEAEKERLAAETKVKEEREAKIKEKQQAMQPDAGEEGSSEEASQETEEENTAATTAGESESSEAQQGSDEAQESENSEESKEKSGE